MENFDIETVLKQAKEFEETGDAVTLAEIPRKEIHAIMLQCAEQMRENQRLKRKISDVQETIDEIKIRVGNLLDSSKKLKTN